MEINTFMAAMEGFKKRIPYQPFTVVLVNGDRFEVDFPDALLVRDGVGVYLRPGGAFVIFDYQGVNQVISDLMDAPKS